MFKSFERLVKRYLETKTQHLLDPLQFTYQSNKGVDDAILTLLHIVYSHLEDSKNHVRILFADFLSAFNTILPTVLVERLTTEFYLDGGMIMWLRDFLRNRVQRVSVGGSMSEKQITNVGSPQGCVLSPLLFILYTNHCISAHSGRFFIKFADDTALVSLLKGDEDSHGPVLNEFTEGQMDRGCEQKRTAKALLP